MSKSRTDHPSDLPGLISQAATTTNKTATNCQMLGAGFALAYIAVTLGTGLCLAFADKEEEKDTAAKIFIGLWGIAGVMLIGMCVGKLGGCIKNDAKNGEQAHLLTDVNAERLSYDGVMI